jgi:hypothetical protein
MISLGPWPLASKIGGIPMNTRQLLEGKPVIPKGCTFLIKIMYTQNSSAQGQIHWIEEERVLSFRSFMELFYLMGEAVGESSETNGLRTWAKDYAGID